MVGEYAAKIYLNERFGIRAWKGEMHQRDVAGRDVA